MSKTNCINCGASKEINDLQCPFCGTKYADLTTFDLFHDHEFYVQLRSSNGAVKTAKAYINGTEIQMHPNTIDCRDVSGRLQRLTDSINITGSIDFTLYESI